MEGTALGVYPSQRRPVSHEPTGPRMAPTKKRITWLADQPVQRKIVLAIGALLAVFVAINLANLASLGREKENRDWSSHTYVVLLTLSDLSNAAQGRQAALRGYLLSRSDAEYADFQ